MHSVRVHLYFCVCTLYYGQVPGPVVFTRFRHQPRRQKVVVAPCPLDKGQLESDKHSKAYTDPRKH